MENITKSKIRELVEAGDHQVLLAFFDDDPARVRRYLMRLTRASGSRIHQRAIACFEMLARKRAEKMPDFFLEIIRRSLWEMNEEGGNVAWSAPEVACAVIAGAPARFGAYFSYVFYAAVDEPTFQPSLLAACEHLAAAAPELMRGFEGSVQVLRETM